MSTVTVTTAPTPTYSMHDKSTEQSGGVSSNVSRLKNMFQTDDAPPRRSPDTKRKRASEPPDQRPNKQRSPDNLLEPALADPQKFYETTSHVQRFKLTRSLFEKMEQENSGAPVYRSSRSKSPATNRTVSPSPARSPSAGPPDSKESRFRAGSVENIIDEQTYNRKYRHPASTTAQDLSRSESDLSRPRSGSDVVVTASIQHPKSLIEQYESKSHSTVPQAQQQHRSYSRSPSRDPPQSPNATSGSTQNSLPVSPDSYRSRYGSTGSGAVRREKSPEPSSRRPASTSRTSSASADADSDIVERWRNRYNKDKHTPAASSAVSAPDTSHNNGSSSGALLWKRRSTDESGISKEEIEASLADADKYFSNLGNLTRGHGETSEVLDSRMTDSTYSSGSGEEMARSESGHDLTTTPDSPTTPTTPTNDYNWAGASVSKYGLDASSSKPALSPKPELPTKPPPPPPQSEPPSYSASVRGSGGGYPAQMIQDDLDADYVDITATISPPSKKSPPTPMDSLAKKRPPHSPTR